jgi:hypothetical protein
LRCRVCSLPEGKRLRIERRVRDGTPLRRVSEMLRREGIIISYASISRHGRHARIGQQTRRREIGDFIESMLEFRPVALTVNVDRHIRKVLARKQRMLQSTLKRSGYRMDATMSSVANYFLGKGAKAIASHKAEADRALYDFMRQRASFANSRKRRVEGRPLSTMISKELDLMLQTDVAGSVWVYRPFEELRDLWDRTAGAIRERGSLRLPHPSVTDYVNLAMKAGLEAHAN